MSAPGHRDGREPPDGLRRVHREGGRCSNDSFKSGSLGEGCCCFYVNRESESAYLLYSKSGCQYQYMYLNTSQHTVVSSDSI